LTAHFCHGTTRRSAPKNAIIEAFFKLGDARTNRLLGDIQVFRSLVHTPISSYSKDGINRESIGNVAASNGRESIVTIFS